MKYKLLETDQELFELVERFADEEAVIVDTEFMRRDTFYPLPALVQLCFPSEPDAAWLIDPLKISDFSPLVRLLQDPDIVKVLHSPSEDLELFQRFLGCLPEPMFDTQRAAAFVGLRFGLGYRALLAELAGIEVDKDETRSDWLARPLTQRQLEYAAADVVPLLPVYRQLCEQLDAKGRMPWVLEDCAAAIAAAIDDPPPYYLRIKSAWKLSQRQLAVLRDLCEWRDQRARQRDKPRSWIIDDKACLALAQSCPEHTDELRQLPELPGSVVRKLGDALLEVVRAAQALSDDELPAPLPRPLDAEQRKQLKGVKQAAAVIARSWEMEPEGLLPSKDYELMVRLANGEPVIAPERWSGWRSELLVKPLLQGLGVGSD